MRTGEDNPSSEGRLGDGGRRVLIVEDEPGISRTLDAFLRREGYLTDVATTGQMALTLFQAARPDLVLLDVLLPGLDGFEVLKAIRRAGNVPVIMLTARSEEVDRLVGLELGADDYVVKPFSFREVVARVRAVLRRARPAPDSAPIRIADLLIDESQGLVEYGGRDVPVTATEFRLLLHLASAPGRLYSRWELIDSALPESDIVERTLDSHIKNLRRKLGNAGAPYDLVRTVRGMGFRLAVPDTRSSEAGKGPA